MATIEQIVNDYFEKQKEEVRRLYYSRGVNASGGFGDSLAVEVETAPNKVIGRLTGAEYSYYADNGRRPGKRPPIDTIEKWINDKQIRLDNISVRSLAFLIARKIGREGTKGAHIIDEVFTPQSFADLTRELGQSFLNDAKEQIVKKFS